MMKTTCEVCRLVKRLWAISAIGLAGMLEPGAVYGDVHLDVLKTRTESFTNVTVYSRSRTDIFIRHSRGITNIKLENLAPETIARLESGNSQDGSATSGNPAVAAQENESSSPTTNTTASISFAKLNTQLRERLAAFKTMPAVHVSPVVVGLVLGGLFAIYLFVCYCLKLICQKTGNEPGILIWFPLLQIFPLLRAAGMPGWWFLGYFVPVVNLIVPIVWCFKIVRARGKSVWAAIGLLFPITNIAALLYLAFSGGSNDESSGNQRMSVSGAPLPVEA